MGILSFLNNYIIGQLGDQIGTLWLGQIFYYKEFDLLRYYSIEYFSQNPQNFDSVYFSNIYNFTYLTLSIIFGSFLSYNFLTILFLLLNSFSLFYLLRKLRISVPISLIFSLIFSILPYFYFHIEHHTLLVLFPSIMFISFLLCNKLSKLNFVDVLYISILLNLQILISLYLGYFLAIYFFLYVIIEFFKERSNKILLNFFFSLLISSLIFLVSNFNTLKSFISPEVSKITYNFPNNIYANQISSFSYEVERPLDDFLYFSSRPWYYFMYHTNHPFFGEYTKKIVEYFSQNLDIWIFKNHFPIEHNSSFLGFTIIVLTILGFKYKIIQRSTVVSNLFILSSILVILTFPPIIPIGSFKLYTPSYLMYEIFPMFRSTSRLSIFVHINFFIIAAFILNDLTLRIEKKRKYLYLFIIFVFMSFDFIGNYKKVGYQMLTETNEFLLKNNKVKSMVVVYPNSFRNDFLLNMVYHKSPFFNPSGFVRKEINFNSSDFTSKLDSCKNLTYFKSFNGGYIVIRSTPESEFRIISQLETIFESKKENIYVKSLEKLNDICKN